MGTFKVGGLYTREQIHDEYGGQVQSYLPTKHGEVTCICVTKELNPSFGERFNGNEEKYIFIGKGEQRPESARKLLGQEDKSLPTFVKESSGQWRYIGNYFCKDVSFDSQKVYEYGASLGFKPTEVVGVITLMLDKKIEKGKVLLKKAS